MAMKINDYIKKVGKKIIYSELGIPVSTQEKWETLEKCPRPKTAAILIENSNGLLTWDSIYAPYIEAQKLLKDH